MALKGNVKIWKIRNSGKYEPRTISYPEGYSDESLAGQDVIIQDPILEEYIDQEIDNAYVVVRIASMHLEDTDRIVPDENGNDVEIETPRGETKNGHRLWFRYNIYSSKEARQDKFFQPDLELDTAELIFVDDLALDNKNIIEYCYDYLKTKKGFEDLVND